MALFNYQPEAPLVERLRFLSEVFVSKNANEQRVNLRKAPRQEFDFVLLMEDRERAQLENIFFDNLTDSFDIPVWSDGIFLTSAATAGDSSVTTYDLASPPTDLGWTPAYNDFRTGGKALVRYGDDLADLVTNISVSSNVISFDETLVNSYPRGAMIYPVRPAIIGSGKVSVARYRVNMTKYTLTFRVTDNDVSIGDSSVFPQFQSKSILNDANAVQDVLSESWQRQIFISDGNTGVIEPTSFWDRSIRGSSKTFRTVTRQRLWEVRRLLHDLRGMQKSFWLPTFGKDITVTSNIGISDTVVNVRNDGYAVHSRFRTPRNVLRLVLNNGTAYNKSITDSVVVSPTVEQITLDTALGAAVNVADISYVSILEKVRLDSDEVTITHKSGLGQAEIGFPVKAVLA